MRIFSVLWWIDWYTSLSVNSTSVRVRAAWTYEAKLIRYYIKWNCDVFRLLLSVRCFLFAVFVSFFSTDFAFLDCPLPICFSFVTFLSILVGLSSNLSLLEVRQRSKWDRESNMKRAIGQDRKQQNYTGRAWERLSEMDAVCFAFYFAAISHLTDWHVPRFVLSCFARTIRCMYVLRRVDFVLRYYNQLRNVSFGIYTRSNVGTETLFAFIVRTSLSFNFNNRKTYQLIQNV